MLKLHAKNKMRKKWWLFHAMDFESLMYPCFIVCRILGIFPYKFNASTFVASKPRYIISTVIICVCCILYLLFIYNIIISNYHFGSVIRNLQAISYYTFTGLIMVVTHALSGPRMHLLQTILDISLKLPSASYQNMSKFIHVKDTLGIILRAVQLYMNFSRIQDFELNSMPVLNMMVLAYVSMLVFQINMLYINCVCVLKAYFKRINDNLVHIQRLVVNGMKPRVPRFICHVQRSQFLLIKLKILKKQHLMASNTVQMLNIIFSLQLIATLVSTYISITFELYFYIVRWQDGVSFNLDKRFLDVLLTSTAYNIFKIMIIVWACETCKNQAQETRTTVHNLLNSINDEKIKNELQLFSLQILHCRNTFSAKGFTVDATLLTAIVGNISTYLLILIQFLNMSHSCDKKTAIRITQSN